MTFADLAETFEAFDKLTPHQRELFWELVYDDNLAPKPADEMDRRGWERDYVQINLVVCAALEAGVRCDRLRKRINKHIGNEGD